MLGERVGNYVITQKLGEGGMGEVYLAEHPQIGKKVALKVLHARLAANQEVVARFFQEAKAVNDIGHPNIVDIVDFGEVNAAAGKCVYLVMELLKGVTLSKIIEGGPLDETRVVHILHQVADALATSHERGIVHRDLKPDNIMLVSRGREQDFVKLLDFGIAKVTEGSAAKTRAGMVIGTPNYMSPEQCEGRATIDHRTDIYALGIVLYEMLTGRIPFTGDGHAEILIKQITEAPAPPSTLRPGISPHLEAVTLKALQKRPEDRYATMRELITALGPPPGVPAMITYADTGPQPLLTPLPRMHPPTNPPPRMQPPTNPPPATGPGADQPGYAQTSPPVTSHPASGRGLAIGVIAGVVVIAVAITIVVTRGGDEATTKAASTDVATTTPASGTPTPTSGTPTPTSGTPTPTSGTPTPTPASGTPTPTSGTPTPTPTQAGGTPTPTTTPAQGSGTPTHTTTPPLGTGGPTETVKLSFTTTPAGALIFLGGENVARCKAPCSFAASKTDGDATIVMRYSGFVEQKRVVRLNADQNVVVTLVKKPPRQSGSGRTTSGQTGDNLLDPSDL